MNDAMLAALVALGTAVVLKALDWLLGRGSQGIAARKDMREEIAQLWKRNDDLEKHNEQHEQEIDALRTENNELRRDKTEAGWAARTIRDADERGALGE